MGKLTDVVEALPGFLHLLGIQGLPKSLLGQMSVQLQLHPGLAVLTQEVAFVRPEMNWRMTERQMASSEGRGKMPHSSLAPLVWEFSRGVDREDGFKLLSKQILMCGGKGGSKD